MSSRKGSLAWAMHLTEWALTTRARKLSSIPYATFTGALRSLDAGPTIACWIDGASCLLRDVRSEIFLMTLGVADGNA